MSRKFLGLVVLSTVGSLALFDGQAGAAGWRPPAPPVIIDPSPSLRLAAACVPEYAAAGVGSSNGLTYAIEGWATSSTEIPAMQVGCRFWDAATGSPYATWESGYKPGPTAALAETFTVDTLDYLVTCIKVDRIDPVSGEIDSTGWVATNGSYCG